MKFPSLALVATLWAAHAPSVQSAGGCTFIQIVMDESGSMEKEQDFLKDVAMPQVIEDLRIEFAQTVFVCSWGFGFTDGGKYVAWFGSRSSCLCCAYT